MNRYARLFRAPALQQAARFLCCLPGKGKEKAFALWEAKRRLKEGNRVHRTRNAGRENEKKRDFKEEITWSGIGATKP